MIEQAERTGTQITEHPPVDLEAMGRAAKAAGRALAMLTSAQKNAALRAIADEVEAQAEAVLAANARDVADARARGVTDAFLDRLLLTPTRVRALAADTRNVAALPDPVGTELESRVLPNGMRLSRRRIPLGVVGVIYEARPNVTIDIAALCLKTGNAAILRGGSETLRSNVALVNVIRAALDRAGLPADAVQTISNPDRALVAGLLRLEQYVDMIIPRGGWALHRLCKEQSTIPVITGGIGVCHIYVDASADQARAVDIIENSKIQKPSACNALDTVLVNAAIADEFLPRMAARLAGRSVEIRAAGHALEVLQENGHAATVKPAGPEDFGTEFLGMVLSVKVVDSVGEAVEHIHRYSFDHTDAILTNDWNNAQRFVNEVNSAVVFVNASTRFNDGAQFGLGAEVAISTQKLHARGPMGLDALTTYKWVGLGDWQVRP